MCQFSGYDNNLIFPSHAGECEEPQLIENRTLAGEDQNIMATNVLILPNKGYIL